MQIIKRENGGFECIYPKGSGVVRCISDNTIGSLQFELDTEETRSFPFPKMYDSTYNGQFGISVTKDGKRFFTQSWRDGLFCYSLETGELLWRFKRKHAWKIILDDEKLVCFFSEWGAAAISVSDGMLINRYPLSTDLDECEIVDESHMMLGPKRDTFSIIDLDLNEQYRIPFSVLNPGNFFSFLIQKAEMKDGCLTISGCERAFDHKREDDEKSLFIRSIPLGSFKLQHG